MQQAKTTVSKPKRPADLTRIELELRALSHAAMHTDEHSAHSITLRNKLRLYEKSGSIRRGWKVACHWGTNVGRVEFTLRNGDLITYP